jgi:uncharacterized membrane protein YvbJ
MVCNQSNPSSGSSSGASSSSIDNGGNAMNPTVETTSSIRSSETIIFWATVAIALVLVAIVYDRFFRTPSKAEQERQRLTLQLRMQRIGV